MEDEYYKKLEVLGLVERAEKWLAKNPPSEDWLKQWSKWYGNAGDIIGYHST